MSQYVALLRGINVGGKNLIRMTDLQACFEEQGFRNVATYIQSGNVLFESAEPGRTELARRIEKALAARFEHRASLVLRTRRQLQQVVEQAPGDFGASPERYRYDVIFLREPLTAPAALEGVPTRPGVDAAHAGKGVLYFSRLAARASRSQLSRLTSQPIYQSMTIRNWNTTTTLLRMMEGGRK